MGEEKLILLNLFKIRSKIWRRLLTVADKSSCKSESVEDTVTPGPKRYSLTAELIVVSTSLLRKMFTFHGNNINYFPKNISHYCSQTLKKVPVRRNLVPFFSCHIFSCHINETLCAIWYHLYNFKNMRNTHE